MSQASPLPSSPLRAPSPANAKTPSKGNPAPSSPSSPTLSSSPQGRTMPSKASSLSLKRKTASSDAHPKAKKAAATPLTRSGVDEARASPPASLESITALILDLLAQNKDLKQRLLHLEESSEQIKSVLGQLKGHSWAKLKVCVSFLVNSRCHRVVLSLSSSDTRYSSPFSSGTLSLFAIYLRLSRSRSMIQPHTQCSSPSAHIAALR